MGVNDGDYDPAAHHIISNASCTTNCVAPMAKVLDEAFGIVRGLMTTIHAYTNDQVILDFPHKDLRRARAAAQNIIPTTTGAAKATGSGAAAAEGQARRHGDARARARRLRHRPGGDPEGARRRWTRSTRRSRRRPTARSRACLVYTEDPIVSSDIVGRPQSCTFDASMTMVSGPVVKIIGWYDNEWGYSSRLVDLVGLVGSRL